MALGRGVLLGFTVDVGIGVRVEVNVEDGVEVEVTVAVNVLVRDGVKVCVGVEVNVWVDESVVGWGGRGVWVVARVGGGRVRVGSGSRVVVEIAVGVVTGAKSRFATFGPNNADAPVAINNKTEMMSHCQPARIRACRVR